jgi:hypothetical protein
MAPSLSASRSKSLMLGLFLEESARLQTEAMRLGTPMFMQRDEAEKIAKRTFKPTSVERA